LNLKKVLRFVLELVLEDLFSLFSLKKSAFFSKTPKKTGSWLKLETEDILDIDLDLLKNRTRTVCFLELVLEDSFEFKTIC